MKKRIIALLSVAALAVGMFSTIASAAPATDTIKTRDELIAELKEINSDGKVTTREQQKLVKDTDEKVLSSFMSEKWDDAFDILENEEIRVDLVEKNDGSLYGERRIDLGDECYIEIIIEDKEDVNIVQKSAAAINSAFVKEAMAGRTQSSQVTKSYGDRYYSTMFRIYIGGGGAKINLINHYNLSASGIKERYGKSSCSGVGVGIAISESEPVITDSVATQPGKSDTNMYCKYHYSTSLNSWNVSGTKTINSRLIYDSINKTAKTITLTQESTLNDY